MTQPYMRAGKDAICFSHPNELLPDFILFERRFILHYTGGKMKRIDQQQFNALMKVWGARWPRDLVSPTHLGAFDRFYIYNPEPGGGCIEVTYYRNLRHDKYTPDSGEPLTRRQTFETLMSWYGGAHG